MNFVIPNVLLHFANGQDKGSLVKISVSHAAVFSKDTYGCTMSLAFANGRDLCMVFLYHGVRVNVEDKVAALPHLIYFGTPGRAIEGYWHDARRWYSIDPTPDSPKHSMLTIDAYVSESLGSIYANPGVYRSRFGYRVEATSKSLDHAHRIKGGIVKLDQGNAVWAPLFKPPVHTLCEHDRLTYPFMWHRLFRLLLRK
jgi:hypothetical protein